MMDRRIAIITSFSCALLSTIAVAQTRGVFVTPIPNAPLMAVVTVQRSRILPTGTTVNQKTMSAIARDSHGKIFNERRPFIAVSDSAVPPIISIHIYDPQTRINSFLDPQNQVVYQGMVNRPPSTLPPDVGQIPFVGTSLPSEYVKEEDLGHRKMEGVDVHGLRETQTISTEANGGKEIKVVDEYWYSDELRLNMLVIHKDPRTGEQTTEVTQVSRGEPPASIFDIPSNYKVTHPGQDQ
jgi:hypothetical protein